MRLHLVEIQWKVRNAIEYCQREYASHNMRTEVLRESTHAACMLLAVVMDLVCWILQNLAVFPG